MDTFVPKGNISGPIVPEFVLKMSITAGAKLIYGVLCWHAFDKDFCWPSYATLADRIGCSISSVKNYMRELVTAKLIVVKSERFRSSKFYMLKPEESMKPDQQDFQPATTASCDCGATPDREPNLVPCEEPKFDQTQPNFARQEPNPGYLKNPEKETNETNHPITEPDSTNEIPAPMKAVVGGGDFSDSDFEKLYDAYPRKEAKGLARCAWRNLIRQKTLPSLATLLEAIERFKNSANWQRENGRFIPQLCNFLKGERWTDPLTEAEILDQRRTTQSSLIKKREQERISRKIQEYNAKKEKLLPIFEAFAAKFQQKYHRPQIIGQWMAAYDNGVAPLAQDVPEDNNLGISQFIERFGNKMRYDSQKTDLQKTNNVEEKPSRHTTQDYSDKPSCVSFNSENRLTPTKNLVASFMENLRGSIPAAPNPIQVKEQRQCMVA